MKAFALGLVLLAAFVVADASIVHFEGRYFRTLDNIGAESFNAAGCQQSFLQIPSGWKIAPDNAVSQRAAHAYGWGTHVVVLASGRGYGTKLYNAGQWSNGGLLEWQGATVKPRHCHLRILLTRKGGFGRPKDQFHGNAVRSGGYLFRTLDRSPPNESQVGCQTAFIKVPRGWRVAPDDDRSRRVVHEYRWGTHVVALANGNSYGTKNYNGGLWSRNVLEKNANGVKPRHCHLRVLIRRRAGAGGSGGSGGLGKRHRECKIACSKQFKSCSTSAECAQQLTGKSYMSKCQIFHSGCRRTCENNYQRVTRCYKSCTDDSKKCFKIADCARPVAGNLRPLCLRRKGQCARRCITSYSQGGGAPGY